MGIKGSGQATVYWQTQLPVDYIDTTLVQNNWETVSANLSGGRPARVYAIIVEQTNNGATAEDITLEVTINGTAYAITGTLNSGTPYYVIVRNLLETGDFAFLLISTARNILEDSNTNTGNSFTARTIGLIRTRQTTDVDGTSAQIEVNIVWEKLVGL